MITLKESILSRSSHGVKGFEAQRREVIEDWLKEHDIRKYTINDDFTVDVNGEVDLYKRNLTEFPDYIQFGVVKGGFDCRNNVLTSLRGCPREVGGVFDCSYNKLTSLEGVSKEVEGNFHCYNNKVRFTIGDVRKICNVKGMIFP